MAAAHHPHILSCPTGGGMPLPRPGQAVFARAPMTDEGNRLVFEPLGSKAYFQDISTLPQYILRENPALAAEIRTAVDTPIIDNVKAAYSGLEDLRKDAPARFTKRLDTIKQEGIDGLRSLVLGDLVFLGVMVSDNLTSYDREWWSERGQLQLTTCVEGIATVFFDADEAERTAADAFTPLSPAVWDIVANALVPSGEEGSEDRVIGTILSTGVREVNILTDVSLYAT